MHGRRPLLVLLHGLVFASGTAESFVQTPHDTLGCPGLTVTVSCVAAASYVDIVVSSGGVQVPPRNGEVLSGPTLEGYFATKRLVTLESSRNYTVICSALIDGQLTSSPVATITSLDSLSAPGMLNGSCSLSQCGLGWDPPPDAPNLVNLTYRVQVNIEHVTGTVYDQFVNATSAVVPNLCGCGVCVVVVTPFCGTLFGESSVRNVFDDKALSAKDIGINITATSGQCLRATVCLAGNRSCNFTVQVGGAGSQYSSDDGCASFDCLYRRYVYQAVLRTAAQNLSLVINTYDVRNATAQISADGVTVSCGFRPDSDADSCLVILTKPIDPTYVLFVVISRAPESADVVSCLVTSLLPGMYRAYAYAAWGASFGVPEVEFNFQWVAAQASLITSASPSLDIHQNIICSHHDGIVAVVNSNGSGIIHCFTSPNCSSPLAPGNYLVALLSFVDGKLGNCQVKGKIVEIPPVPSLQLCSTLCVVCLGVLLPLVLVGVVAIGVCGIVLYRRRHRASATLPVAMDPEPAVYGDGTHKVDDGTKEEEDADQVNTSFELPSSQASNEKDASVLVLPTKTVRSRHSSYSRMDDGAMDDDNDGDLTVTSPDVYSQFSGELDHPSKKVNICLMEGDAQGTLTTGEKQGILATGEKQGTLATCEKQDTLATGEKQDTLTTGEKQDTLTTGEKQDTLATGEKQDTLTTGEKQDTLATGEKQDTLTTGEKQDTLATGEKQGILAIGEGLSRQHLPEERKMQLFMIEPGAAGDRKERYDPCQATGDEGILHVFKRDEAIHYSKK